MLLYVPQQPTFAPFWFIHFTCLCLQKTLNLGNLQATGSFFKDLELSAPLGLSLFSSLSPGSLTPGLRHPGCCRWMCRRLGEPVAPRRRLEMSYIGTKCSQTEHGSRDQSELQTAHTVFRFLKQRRCELLRKWKYNTNYKKGVIIQHIVIYCGAATEAMYCFTGLCFLFMLVICAQLTLLHLS